MARWRRISSLTIARTWVEHVDHVFPAQEKPQPHVTTLTSQKSNPVLLPGSSGLSYITLLSEVGAKAR